MMDEIQSYVYIQEDELEKLQKNSSRLKTIEDALSQRTSFIHSEVEKQILDKISRIERRNAEFQRFVYDLNGELKYYEIENQRRSNEQNQKLAFLRNEYMQILYKEREEYTSLVKQQEEKLAELIIKGHNERQNTVNKLKSDIDSLLSDNIRKKEKVSEFIFEIGKIIKETEKLPHQKFAPGMMEKISYSYKQVCFDLQEEFFESALVSGRNIYLDIVNMRDTIQENEYKLIAFQALITEKTLSLAEKIKLNKIRVMEFDGNDKKHFFELNIDFWSSNKLSVLKDEVDKIYKEITLKHNEHIIDDLEKIKIILDEKEKELDIIIDDAINNIIDSQLRANTAWLITGVLKEMFCVVTHSFYRNNDKRKEYCVNLKNIAGSVIKLIIKSDNEIYLNVSGKSIVSKDLYEVLSEYFKINL